MKEKRGVQILLGWVILSWGLFGFRVLRDAYMGAWPESPDKTNEVRLLLQALDSIESISFREERNERPRLARQKFSQFDPKPQSVDLNQADSALLESLPRIGPILAARICRFREALGGFYTVNQLREVWGLEGETATEIIPWFHIGSGVYRHICVDTASWSTMRTHPYIRADGARIIERFRLHHALDSVGVLYGSVLLNDSVIRRWSPYLRVCENPADSL